MRALALPLAVLTLAVAGCGGEAAPTSSAAPDCLITEKLMVKLCDAPALATCETIATADQGLRADCVIRPKEDR